MQGRLDLGNEPRYPISDSAPVTLWAQNRVDLQPSNVMLT